jgi:hypothetical protein
MNNGGTKRGREWENDRGRNWDRDNRHHRDYNRDRGGSSGLTEMIPIEAFMICSVVMMTKEAMARIQVHETISTMMRVTLRFNTNLQATIYNGLLFKDQENDCSFPFQT